MRSQSVTDSGRIMDESELTGIGQGEQRRNDRTEPISLTSIVNVNVVEMNQTTGRISTEDANDSNDISRSTRDTPVSEQEKYIFKKTTLMRLSAKIASTYLHQE